MRAGKRLLCEGELAKEEAKKQKEEACTKMQRGKARQREERKDGKRESSEQVETRFVWQRG